MSRWEPSQVQQSEKQSPTLWMNNPMAGKQLLKGLGVTMDHLLEIHKRRPPASWAFLGGWVSQEDEGRWSFLSTQHWSDQQCVLFWVPLCKKDMFIPDRVQGRSMTMKRVWSIRHLRKWLRRLEPFGWKTWGDHISMYKYLSRKDIRHWKGVPREASTLSLEILKNPTRATCYRSLCLAQESCDRRSSVKPSNPSLLVIPWTCKDQI